MKNRSLFILASAGALVGLLSAVYYGIERKPLAPVFDPTANPYAAGIYANGIVQSDQTNGTNIALYPEVAGSVIQIPVSEGQRVKRGDVLLVLDATVQQATVEQLLAQAQAAEAALAELRAEPRPESLAVVTAQVDVAQATLKMNSDNLIKLQGIAKSDPGLISRDQLDNATNAVAVATAGLSVARRQYELAKAGAWKYDVQSQTQQSLALDKAYQSAAAQLAKYTLRAPVDGTVLSIQTAVGSYVSVQGTYDSISAANGPLILMGGGAADELSVRCYIDEILIQRLALTQSTPARMFIRGTQISIPLQYVRIEPYVSPKIQLSSGRTERVDLRVLPVIFRMKRPPGVQLYPGQMVDVYIESAAAPSKH
jgi:HlyD family secretion protein